MNDELWTTYWKSRSVEDRNRIVERHIGFAVSRAQRAVKTWGRVNLSDAIQDGSMGLVEAVERFSPTGLAFLTFAVRFVDGRIVDGIRKADPLPRGFRKRAAIAGGKAPRFASLSEAFDVAAPEEESQAEMVEFWQWSMRQLRPRHRAVIRLRFENGCSASECARKLDCSRDCVNSSLSRAVSKLRRLEAAHV